MVINFLPSKFSISAQLNVHQTWNYEFDSRSSIILTSHVRRIFYVQAICHHRSKTFRYMPIYLNSFWFWFYQQDVFDRILNYSIRWGFSRFTNLNRVVSKLKIMRTCFSDAFFIVISVSFAERLHQDSKNNQYFMIHRSRFVRIMNRRLIFVQTISV